MDEKRKALLACDIANTFGIILLLLIIFLEKVKSYDLYIVFYLIFENYYLHHRKNNKKINND